MTPKPKKYKLVIFIPESHLEKVRSAICTAGAGRIGNYDNCCFISKGMGTYRPREEAKPYKGRIGKITRTKEVRLETVVSSPKLSAVLSALQKSHPYEEVAFDLYPLYS